ncbi:toprim domain-containing protein [Roseibium sp. RKSG952]|uniref:DUF7146 domain-containing protein n=1 Tax=Roseibium sp. RKSG952 TaxID=2529384 RepID=UPI0012BB7167|nr:toprim domain-containing protein [Roseibium sp. RKSG952]MTH96562.1 P4 alpha zinc-binding domain protein [Roseibium sp. RKSG952]
MTRISDLCRNKWPDLLLRLGVDRRYLTGKHGPCPICNAGTDRFRFDDKDGLGTFFCNSCGAGDGFKLLMEIRGWNFAECAKALEAIVGGAHERKPDQPVNPDKLKSAKNTLWCGARPVLDGNPVAKWLQNRGIHLERFPDALRYAERCSYHHEQNRFTHHPAMIAMVTGPDGKPTTLHRTFLTPLGNKADVPKPRLVMPGKIAKGSAIRLFEPAEVMGIAEGIETALAAHLVWQIPVWAGLNAGMVMQWQPPAIAKEIHIFGDHDANFAGQSSAFALAHRLSHEGKTVTVQFPDEPGDWNDFLLSRQYRKAG